MVKSVPCLSLPWEISHCRGPRGGGKGRRVCQVLRSEPMMADMANTPLVHIEMSVKMSTRGVSFLGKVGMTHFQVSIWTELASLGFWKHTSQLYAPMTHF